jgi:hypothetical protein
MSSAIAPDAPSNAWANPWRGLCARAGEHPNARLEIGKEIYRQRLPIIGSGYSTSSVAADGKIY